MTLRSRLAAIERAARRRRRRYPVAMVPSPLKLDMSDPAVLEVLRKVDALLGDRIQRVPSGLGPIAAMHAQINKARLIMETPAVAGQYRDMIEKAFADDAPVVDTGDVEHEEWT